MYDRRQTARRRWLPYVAVAALGLLVACSGGASVGETCSTSGECQAHLQCLHGHCTPRCATPSDCGDGYRCEAGECQQVFSRIGDPCDRELDCGPGQTCRLEVRDADDDGWLAATCELDGLGAPTGAACTADTDCRNRNCSLGRCTEVCSTSADCPRPLECVSMPRILAGSAPMFRGCLQAGGTIELAIPVSAPHEQIRVPVPSSARSFALVARIDADDQMVGVSSVHDPEGRLLYATPHDATEFYKNPIRYQPAPEISTLLVPNTPAVELLPGAYTVEVGSFTRAGGNGNAIPDVTVRYKLDAAARLDLTFYFLKLDAHPCLASGTFRADDARDSALFQNVFLRNGLEAIFASAGVTLGEIRYRDLQDRPDLDGLDSRKLARLLRLSEPTRGINVFFVRSIHPPGVQALVGGTPGPPGVSGTGASGIAVSMDTLCYRDWQAMARLTAHEIGRHLGLFRNREPDGQFDPIPDSDDSAQNLMFFSEFGGTYLSPGQAEVLRSYPGLQ